MVRDPPSDDETAPRGPTAAEQLGGSLIQLAAESLVDSIAPGKGAELREETSRLTGNAPGEAVDAAAFAGIALGANREQIKSIMQRRAAARSPADASPPSPDDDDGDDTETTETTADSSPVSTQGDLDEPLVHGTEIENTEGDVVGVRMYVDYPPEQVDVYMGTDEVLVKTPAADVTKQLGFSPANIEWESDDSLGISQFVLRPASDVDDTTDETTADAPSDEE